MKNYLYINQSQSVKWGLTPYDAIFLKYLVDTSNERGTNSVRMSYIDAVRDLPILRTMTLNRKEGVETLLINLWAKDLIEYKAAGKTFLYSLKGDAGVICEVSL